MEKYINFEDLQIEYKIFIEYFFYTHNILEELTKNTVNFLKQNNKNYNQEFLEEFEINLLYLEYFTEQFDKIFDLIDGITINKLSLPKINKKINIINFEDYIKIPNDYEQDIYVDINESIDWKNKD